jgi:hypothetical protein
MRRRKNNHYTAKVLHELSDYYKAAQSREEISSSCLSSINRLLYLDKRLQRHAAERP